MNEIEQLRKELNELQERVANLDKAISRMQPLQPNTYPPGYFPPQPHTWPTYPSNPFKYQEVWCSAAKDE